MSNGRLTKQDLSPSLAQEIDNTAAQAQDLETRSEEFATQLAQKSNQQLRIVSVDDFVIAPTIDDTNAIMNAVLSLGENEGVVIFSPRQYLSNAITFIGIKNIKFVGNHSTIIYNGSKDVSIQGQNNSNIFKFDNCENVVCEDFYFKGKMFDGLDKINLPTEAITDSEYVTDQHRGVYALNCKNITIKNCHVTDVYAGFRFNGCDNVNLNNLITKDIASGFTFMNTTNIKGNYCEIYDARFKLDSVDAGTAGPLVPTIGSGGTGFLFDNSTGLLENSNAYRSATNTFRLQNTSNVKFFNCSSFQARRHGFSIYGDGSVGYFERCHAYDTADPTFWNGKDNENTFRRPHAVDIPTSYIVTDTNNTATFIHCTAKSKLYEDMEIPISNNTNGVFQAISEGSVFKVITGSAKKIVVKDCIFEGYTTKNVVDIYSDGAEIARTKVIGRLMSDNTIIYGLLITGNDVIISDCEIENARDGIQINGSRYVIKGNTIKNSYRTGLAIWGGQDSLVDNNTIINAGRGTPGYGIQVGQQNLTLGTNIVIDNQVESKVSYALRIESAATGLYPGTCIVRGNINKVSRASSIVNDAMPIYGKANTQSDSVATDLAGIKADLNTLLARLKQAGLMA